MNKKFKQQEKLTRRMERKQATENGEEPAAQSDDDPEISDSSDEPN